MAPRDRAADRIVIGLTGPIAAGKSTVAALLRQRGAEIIDGDEVYRSLLTPGSDLARQLAARFGAGILHADGQIDRAALASIVFRDPAALADLDRITHPAVLAEVQRRVSRSPAPVVAIEAIKLVQSGLSGDVDALWLVDAPPDVRLRRLMARGSLDPSEAEARLHAGSDPMLHGVDADVVIDTSGDIDDTARAVASAWAALEVDANSRPPDMAVSAANAKEEC